jgi:hypothetical protein
VIVLIIRPSISDEQHDFADRRSTVTSLVEFSNFVFREKYDARQDDTVYADVLHAFDRINHGFVI